MISIKIGLIYILCQVFCVFIKVIMYTSVNETFQTFKESKLYKSIIESIVDKKIPFLNSLIASGMMEVDDLDTFDK